MTKLDLSEVLWRFKAGEKSHTDCLDAVDAYTEALLKQCIVSGSLPPSKRCDLYADKLSYIGQYCDCKHDECKYLGK